VRIIGIDPGLARVGYGIIEIKNERKILLDCGVIETSKDKKEEDRLYEIFQDLNKLINHWNPTAAAVEKFFFYRSSTTISVVQARGVIMMVLASKKIHVSEYSPAQIKLTIAGSGKASKKDILDAVMYNLDLNKPPKPDDSADALAIALTKLNEDGFNWKFNMTIFENKKLERDTFRKIRDGISLNQRENVEKNVRLYIDSFVKGYNNIGYIGIYWPLKNEVDIRSLIK